MIFRRLAAVVSVGVLLLAGCTSPGERSAAFPAATEVGTGSAGGEAGGQPAELAGRPGTATAEELAYKKPAPPRAKGPGAPGAKPGEYSLLVESEPAGATVVVNGKPLGKTPCRVVVPANRRGFVREQISIKVRFIAATDDQESQTVEDVLTTLDKVPAEIRFTTAGATRVVR